MNKYNEFFAVLTVCFALFTVGMFYFTYITSWGDGLILIIAGLVFTCFAAMEASDGTPK